MTKIIATAFAATFFLAACNESKTTDTTTVGDTTTNTTVTTTTPTTTTTMYTPVEGDVQYSGNKVMVMRNGAWVESDADVKYDGVTVYRDGRVEKGEYEVRLNDGEVVNKDGDFFDKTGNAVSNVWEATKDGASAAGRAVKKGVGKIGDKIEGAVDGDKKGENKDK